MTTAAAHEIDLFVGRQMNLRRRAKGWSQIRLGQALGVSFQQVHKYETGANRVSSSVLWLAAKAFECKEGDFFPRSDWIGAAETPTPEDYLGLGLAASGLDLNQQRVIHGLVMIMIDENKKRGGRAGSRPLRARDLRR